MAHLLLESLNFFKFHSFPAGNTGEFSLTIKTKRKLQGFIIQVENSFYIKIIFGFSRANKEVLSILNRKLTFSPETSLYSDVANLKNWQI